MSSPMRSFLLRPDIRLLQDGATISVFVGDEIAGELVLAQDQVAALHDLSSAETGLFDETSTLKWLIKRGHKETCAQSVLDILVETGLAVRYAASIDAEKAAYIGTWTSHVDAVAGLLAASRVVMVDMGESGDDLARELSGWGIKAETLSDSLPSREWTNDEAGQKPSLIIAVNTDSVKTENQTRWCLDHGVPLLTISNSDDAMEIGPVFIQGVTPCPHCNPNQIGCDAVERTFARNYKSNILNNFVARLVVDCLAGCPGGNTPFLRHRLDAAGNFIESYPAYRNPRCPVCSRLNQFPENAIIHV